MATKRYGVTLPITGTVYVEVEADSEEAAIEAALNSDDLTGDAIESWEATDRIVKGNVFYGVQNEAHAELIADE